MSRAISDAELLDFISQEVAAIHYGEIRRGGCGWVIRLTGHEDSIFARSGNGSSLRKTLRACVRRVRKERA